MAVRLDPSDEFMHELGPESNFNESMYFNFFDRARSADHAWQRRGHRDVATCTTHDTVTVPLTPPTAECLRTRPS